MRHSAKKYLFNKPMKGEVKVNYDEAKTLKQSEFNYEEIQFLDCSVFDDQNHVTTGTFFQGYCILTPHIVVVYFDSGRHHIKLIKVVKEKLFKVLQTPNFEKYVLLHAIHSYFSVCSGCIFFLFNSLEAFVNYMIPVDVIHEYQKTEKSEIKTYQYNKVLELPILIKLNEVLPKITNRKFAIDHPEHWN